MFCFIVELQQQAPIDTEPALHPFPNPTIPTIAGRQHSSVTRVPHVVTLPSQIGPLGKKVVSGANQLHGEPGLNNDYRKDLPRRQMRYAEPRKNG